ncbi:hypothetical protein [Flavobacterium kingsejongi]|uniref:Uncharacterized protein n=1 Tax=Flavobacterium kingsejongi TaxID=1678728 RepID=A0A2S1LPG7_9FLAO|nr:hypothetical protein [Flavobacterium kingsejongi]AWG25598.1 hypothetical protein FK004_10330 [Flavobacterium kingsejongi]
MKGVWNGSAIECAAAEVISRKIIPSSYMEINNVGKCLVYKCYRNSEAKVLKELKPKKALHNQNSCLNIDDRVEGENLLIVVNIKKILKIELKNHTSTHKAQFVNTSNYTYAEISRQIPCIPLLDPPIVFKPVIIEK